MYEYYITPKEYKIAEQNGICKHTLEYRIREAAWDKKKAITEPIKGNKYKKYYEIAKKNGIKENTFRKRISYGMSLEDAATKPIDKDHQSKRKYPKQIFIIAAQNGIKRSTLISRLRLGWNLEDATTIKPNKRIRNESWRKDNARTTARGIIRNKATKEDLEELEELIKERKENENKSL